MNLETWALRAAGIFNRNLVDVTEIAGTFYAWIGSQQIFYSKEMQEKVKSNKLECYCIVEYTMHNLLGKRKIRYIHANEKDQIRVIQRENGNIELECMYTNYSLVIGSSFHHFIKKSDIHKKIYDFVLKEFIDHAPNRLEFITGIIK
jgi:hypothetical protein